MDGSLKRIAGKDESEMREVICRICGKPKSDHVEVLLRENGNGSAVVEKALKCRDFVKFFEKKK